MDVSKQITQFGIIGLTEESKAILLEMYDRGYTGSIYDFDNDDKVKVFLENEAKDTKIYNAKSFDDLIYNVVEPRCIMLFVEDEMIRNSIGTDSTIEDFIDINLLPHLSLMDHIVDAGSSGREDTSNIADDMFDKGIRYLCLNEAPTSGFLAELCDCLRTSNPAEWYRYQKGLPKLGQISGVVKYPCCFWGNPKHKDTYIQFVVNKLLWLNERLINEVEAILSDVGELNRDEIGYVFADWCQGDLNSMLCQQKSSSYQAELEKSQLDLIENLKKAALACQIIHYAHGYSSIMELDRIHEWNIDFAEVKPADPEHYRYKCGFYRKIKLAFKNNPQLKNLLYIVDFSGVMSEGAKAIGVFGDLHREKSIPACHRQSFVEAFEYILRPNKPVCWRLFENLLEDNELMGTIDLSPLEKYQFQVYELLRTMVDIEKAIEKANAESRGHDQAVKLLMSGAEYATIRHAILKLHGVQHEAHYLSCINHMKNDKNVTPFYMRILTSRILKMKIITKKFVVKSS